MNEPKIRFKGFEGEWKKVKIGDVAPLTGGFAFQSGQFKTSGIPIIRISNILSSGIVGGDFVYYNEFKGDSEFRLYKGDVVIAMSGATTGKVATFEANDFGYQNQRVGKFSRTNLVNYELLSKLVGAPNFQKKIISKLTSSAQPNASSKDIDSIDLVVPEDTEEQRALASYFTSLDAQIAASTSRLSSLKQIKAASLLNMFPQKGETVPRVRFKGFQGEWKKKDFSQFVNRISCPGQAGDLPGVEYEDIVAGEGMLNKNLQEKSCNKYGIKFKEGDVLFGKLRPYLKNILLADFEGVAIGDFWVFRPSKCDSKFLYSLVISNDFMKIANISSGSKMPRADWNLISSTFISLPSLSEQRAIASYFTALDAQIILHRERLEKLKQIKAACLEKMFA